MRSTVFKPQLMAISVARDAQGEMVPIRGMTKNNSLRLALFLMLSEAACH